MSKRDLSFWVLYALMVLALGEVTGYMSSFFHQ